MFCKRILEAAKLLYTNKIKDSITSENPGFRDLLQINNSLLNKGKPTTPLLFNGPTASDKAKLFTNFFFFFVTLILMVQVSLYQLSPLELI